VGSLAAIKAYFGVVCSVSVDTRLWLDRATTSTVGRRFRPQNTPERLRAFRAALLAATALLGITAIVVLLGMHSNAVSVRQTAAPAYLDVIEAKAVLTDADRAVWQSVRSGEAQFSGPGQIYEGDITTADQELQQLAALEAPASSGGQDLQTVSAQLVTFQGLVEKADAANRADTALGPASSHALGDAYLGYAGQSLTGDYDAATKSYSGGLIPPANSLTELNQRALNGQLTSSWADPALIAAIATAGVVVFGLIVAFQLFLRRRFRRSISPPLVLAAVVVCGLLAWMFAVILPADNALARARSTALPRVVEIWQQQTQMVLFQAGALQQQGSSGNAPDAAGVLDLGAVQPARHTLNADLGSAQRTDGLVIGIPVAAILVAGLVFLAVKPRLDEYRGVDK
jgi:hypothetical protein